MVDTAKEIVSKLSKLDRPQIYHLRYKQSQIAKNKYFEFTGTLEQAIERARKHVKEMNYQHFVFCVPFTHDLDEDETFWKENKEERFVA